jgi:acyl carrier protein
MPEIPATASPPPPLDEVLAFIASVLQVDASQLREDDGTETVPAWDSLKTLLMASMIEINHGVTLDNSEMERLTTVRAVREVLARHAGR